MITPNDFKPGLTIELDGRVLQIMSAEHHKQGRGDAIVRTRLRDVESGDIFTKTFRSNESIERAHVERRDYQYLYSTGEGYVFMDTEIMSSVANARDPGQHWRLTRRPSSLPYQGKIIGLGPRPRTGAWCRPIRIARRHRSGWRQTRDHRGGAGLPCRHRTDR